MTNKTYLLIFIVLCSCSINKSNEEIKELINSDNVDEVIEGYYEIGESKRISFIKDLFNNTNDVRISHHYKFKGMSIFQSKMIALKKISGLEPPTKITNEEDSIIVSFYYNWAIENNLLK